jgi:membrane protein
MMSQEPPPVDQHRGPAARRTAARVAQRLDSTVVGTTWSRLLEVEFVDRSVALAAKAFVSFLPLLVLVAARSPDNVRGGIVSVFADRFGISGGAFDVVRQAFAAPSQTKSASGLLGALITLAFAVSFTTALQRVYLRAWRRPPGGGAKNKGRGAMWLGGVLVLMMFVALSKAVLDGPTGSVVAWALGLIGTTALWWWTARLMVRGEIRWRALLPTAVVMGIGSWVYTLAAAVWMPTNVASQYAQFGAFGIAQSFVTWFTGLAFLVVFGAVLGPALVDGDSALARWMRSGNTTVLEPDAKPALPGPDRPMRLSDAFGLGAKSSSSTSTDTPPAPTVQE